MWKYHIRLIILAIAGFTLLFTAGYLFGMGLWKTGLLLLSVPFWILFLEWMWILHLRRANRARKYQVYSTKD